MYKEYSLCSILAPLIYRFWEYKGEARSGLKLNIPLHSCSDLIFIVGNVVDCIRNSLIMEPYHSYFFGSMNIFTELVARTNFIHIMGVRFRSCGFFRFIDIPLNELTNQGADSHEFLVFFSQSFVHQFYESDRNPIDATRHELARQVHKNNMNTEKQISYVVSLTSRQKGVVLIRELATGACLGLRQSERKLKLHTGYSPKEYSRIAKFRNVIRLLKSNTSFDNFLFAAIQAGYYGTPYLYREMKRFSGNILNASLSLSTNEKVEVLHIES